MGSAADSGGLAEFPYEGKKYRFRAAQKEDHLLAIMNAQQSFYEIDVLERIRDRRSWPATGSLAVDAGAYIGTHSTYFAAVCECERVICFEANSESFRFLSGNLRANGLEDRVTPINKALGARPGHASIAEVDVGSNKGATSIVAAADGAAGSFPVTTIDSEVGADAAASLIKIDVEGAELDVLRGAENVIRRSRPLLCIEVHSGRQLRSVLHLLRESRYQIVDCLGYSPTYILEPSGRGAIRTGLVNLIWWTRAVLPDFAKPLKSCLRLLGQLLTTGRWERTRNR